MNLRQFSLRVLATPVVANLQGWAAAITASTGGDELDVVFVTPPATAPGWILEAICREVAQRMPGIRSQLCSLGTPLPRARCYFFSHFMYFIESIRGISPVHTARTYVFATHLEADKHGIPDALVARVLARATGVLCMNQGLLHELAELGVRRDRLATLVGAASCHDFQPHRRAPDGLVGFCSAYYPRKSPDTLLNIVKLMPHRRFVLLGRGWKEYPRFAELTALPNFEYAEPDYAEYPNYYARMSVFTSVSQKEGGPIPLIEAMMSNAVPVASHTGFAPDVIEHGKNGFLFPIDAAPQDICALIDRAFSVDTDVRSTIAHCDWEPYTQRVLKLMNLSLRTGVST